MRDRVACQTCPRPHAKCCAVVFFCMSPRMADVGIAMPNLEQLTHLSGALGLCRPFPTCQQRVDRTNYAADQTTYSGRRRARRHAKRDVKHRKDDTRETLTSRRGYRERALRLGAVALFGGRAPKSSAPRFRPRGPLIGRTARARKNRGRRRPNL